MAFSSGLDSRDGAKSSKQENNSHDGRKRKGKEAVLSFFSPLFISCHYPPSERLKRAILSVIAVIIVLGIKYSHTTYWSVHI